MRIVTRPDFDGIVCALLLQEAEKISAPVHWVEPNEMQAGLVEVKSGDIIANLPYDARCTMWFDHHVSNNASDFKGLLRIAPSAAGLVYEYYQQRFTFNYDELVRETDKIDSANLSLDEVNFPEKYPYVLLSMTISGRDKNDEPYWNHVTNLLRENAIENVLKDTLVRHRCNVVINNNILYKSTLKKHTHVKNSVAVTDFRGFPHAPSGNRFLVYSMYPESNVQMKIFNDKKNPDVTIISVGHSIFNRTCNVNVGKMLANFNGGGHRGAGSCNFPKADFDRVFPLIRDQLEKNVADA